MDINQLNDQPSVNAEMDTLLADNMRLQHEVALARQSEDAQVALASELKARVFHMSQQHLRQLDQLHAREDALASAAAREEDLERRLIRAEGEVIEKRAEVLTLTSALMALQRDLDMANSKSDELPALIQTIRALEDQIAAIRSSTSWRVTMPLRKVKDGLKYLSRL